MDKRSAEIKRLRKKADALMQEIVRAECPFCEHCGKPTQVGHHFYSKGSSSELRYNFDNIIALCNVCHMSLHRANNPEIHVKIMRARGGDWFNDLYSRKATKRKRNREYYLGVIEMLEARLETEAVIGG